MVEGIVESANDTTILPFGSVGNGKPPCFLLRKSPCLTIKEHETFPRILHFQRMPKGWVKNDHVDIHCFSNNPGTWVWTINTRKHMETYHRKTGYIFLLFSMIYIKRVGERFRGRSPTKKWQLREVKPTVLRAAKESFLQKSWVGTSRFGPCTSINATDIATCLWNILKWFWENISSTIHGNGIFTYMKTINSSQMQVNRPYVDSMGVVQSAFSRFSCYTVSRPGNFKRTLRKINPSTWKIFHVQQKFSTSTFIMQFRNIPSRDFSMTMENPPWMKMYFLLKMVIFQCHVSFQGSSYVCLQVCSPRLRRSCWS